MSRHVSPGDLPFPYVLYVPELEAPGTAEHAKLLMRVKWCGNQCGTFRSLYLKLTNDESIPHQLRFKGAFILGGKLTNT